MEKVEPLVIGEERVGAILEEKVHDVVITSFGGPKDWCCDSVAAFRVYICAILEEEMA